jgi:ferrous iron transport protein B
MDKSKILEQANELRWKLGEDLHDQLTESIYAEASEIASAVVIRENQIQNVSLDARIDRILTSKTWGFPIMLLLLAGVLWITIEGANYPSQWLSTLLLDTVYPFVKAATNAWPFWLSGLLVDGVYLAVAWVVSVMLPPMAIFFPLFTLLEDFGYLPRVAFNLDRFFKQAGSNGKQALTMSMGFGCNAAGVVATRIISSPRERLIAIITNNFSLCNGRWPTQILISAIFIGAVAPAQIRGIISTAAVLGVALLGIFTTFLVSALLSKTVLRGEVSSFTLELPPYRFPRFWQTVYTSLIDRTLIVLWRAVVFAAPAGALIWMVSNIHIGHQSIALWAIHGLDGFGWLIGLNGVILLAYVLAIPANEIVVPTILMLTVLTLGQTDMGEGAGIMFELNSMADTGRLLRQGGWTLLTAINLMLFSLLHNPCSTTIYTIYKETGSAKWTLFASILPIILGFMVTFIVAQFAYLIS